MKQSLSRLDLLAQSAADAGHGDRGKHRKPRKRRAEAEVPAQMNRASREINGHKPAADDHHRLNEELESRIEQRTRELKRQEAQLRIMANALPVLVAEIDRDQRVRYVNDACRKFFINLQTRAVLGRSLADLLGMTTFDKIARFIAEAFAGRRREFEQEIDVGGSA